MKEKIKLLRTSLKYGGKLNTILTLGFVHGVYNKVTEEQMVKTLNEVFDRAEQADKLEKQLSELKLQVSQPSIFQSL